MTRRQSPTALKAEMAELAQSGTLQFSRAEIVSILFGLILAMFLASLYQTIVATSLSTMARDLNGWALMSWVVSAYLVASTVTTPIYGRLSDLYGRRPILSVAISLFLSASVLCALSQNMPQFIGARVLQGVGGGGLRSVALAAVADIIPPRERPLPGLFFQCHGDLERARAGAGRFFRRISNLALDILDQFAVGIACVVHVLPQPAAADEATAQADHRLARGRADSRLDDADPDCARAGRSGSQLGEERGSRPARDRRSEERRVGK